MIKKIIEFLEESFHDACGLFTNHWMPFVFPIIFEVRNFILSQGGFSCLILDFSINKFLVGPVTCKLGLRLTSYETKCSSPHHRFCWETFPTPSSHNFGCLLDHFVGQQNWMMDLNVVSAVGWIHDFFKLESSLIPVMPVQG